MEEGDEHAIAGFREGVKAPPFVSAGGFKVLPVFLDRAVGR